MGVNVNISNQHVNYADMYRYAKKTVLHRGKRIITANAYPAGEVPHLEVKKGKPNLPLKVEKAKVDEVRTKIVHQVGRKVGTFDPVQGETGSFTDHQAQ